jgi:hypothetical protein
LPGFRLRCEGHVCYDSALEKSGDDGATRWSHVEISEGLRAGQYMAGAANLRVLLYLIVVCFQRSDVDVWNG